jgi:hypothetical protein
LVLEEKEKQKREVIREVGRKPSHAIPRDTGERAVLIGREQPILGNVAQTLE